MWIKHWPLPPATFEELQTWKIYCRIWNDIGMPTPGSWIVMWMKDNMEHEGEYAYDAIIYYRDNCHE